jgi:hypothetical protein
MGWCFAAAAKVRVLVGGDGAAAREGLQQYQQLQCWQAGWWGRHACICCCAGGSPDCDVERQEAGACLSTGEEGKEQAATGGCSDTGDTTGTPSDTAAGAPLCAPVGGN